MADKEKIEFDNQFDWINKPENVKNIIFNLFWDFSTLDK